MKLGELLAFSSRQCSTGSLELGKKDFHALYDLKQQLGKGGFGTVYAAVRRSDGLPVAVKEVSKEERVAVEADGVLREVVLMQLVQDVPGVIKLIDYFDMKECFYIVMERFNSKDLFDFISEQGPLPEALAKDIFRQLLGIVTACHQKGVVHRDIKDENILINMKTFKIKLIDFGSGTFLEDQVYREFQGTRVYAPPEWIQQRAYRPEGLTVWSLGVLLFDMICGDIPFICDAEITRGSVSWPSRLSLSTEARGLVEACLAMEPCDRPGLAGVAAHPWLAITSVPKPRSKLLLPCQPLPCPCPSPAA